MARATSARLTPMPNERARAAPPAWKGHHDSCRSRNPGPRRRAGRSSLDPSGKKITGRSPTRIALDRLRKDRLAIVSGALVLFLVLLAIFAPLVCKIFGIEGPYATNGAADLEFTYPKIGPPFHPFTWDHPLGLAPRTAYDNLARLVYGLRVSLGIALGATLISSLIGIVMGLIAGFARGWPDRIISFIIDLFLSFPFILGALALAPIITSHFATQQDKLKWVQFFSLMAVLVIFGWMYLARLIRGQVLSLREREFIQSAQVLGAPTSRILFRELLPEPDRAHRGVGLADTSGFRGRRGRSVLPGHRDHRVPVPRPDHPAGQRVLRHVPAVPLCPGFAVTVLVVALNLLGDSVRDAFDPKTRR